MRKRILAALLCACLLVPALTAPAFAAFPDVPADEWYTEYVDFCTEKGIVNGFEDGTFRPTGYLRRSEFIKMLATSASLTYKSELPGKHWAEEYWAMLSENGVLEGLDIPCTFDALQAKTTRYEMAVMIRNFLAKVRGETEAVTNGAARRIPDWAYIPEAYRPGRSIRQQPLPSCRRAERAAAVHDLGARERLYAQQQRAARRF